MKFFLLSLILSTFLFAQYQNGKIEMHGGKEEKLFNEKINMINTTFSTLWGKSKKDKDIKKDSKKVIKKSNYIKIENIDKIENIGK
jgi:hypothetical protein